MDAIANPLPHHVPVLAREVLELLDPQPGQVLVDATLGGGGHTRMLVEKVQPGGQVLGLEQDQEMLRLAQPGLAGLPVVCVSQSFTHLRAVLDELKIGKVDAVLADLGFSSDQMDNPERGLSFQQEGPLDMRLDRDSGEPASALLRRLPERQLADLIFEYGEERFSRRIARRIVEDRKNQPLTTTTQLAELVRRCVPRGKGGIDPATRTFQALRIAVNNELGALERLLEQLPECLRPGGKAALISFHSLEDRRVKQAFRQKEIWQELTRKPVVAGADEVRNNPRARSAKLRVAVLRAQT